MLTKPQGGWTDFQLDGTSEYGLSYLDDIAFEWAEQAIHGLKTMRPFCVKGDLEGENFLCVVSYDHCHIICEDDEQDDEQDDVIHEISQTSMLGFCRRLYADIMENIDEWALFTDYGENRNLQPRKDTLLQKLEELRILIAEREDARRFR